MQLYSRNILKLVQRVPRSVIQRLSLSTTSSLDESLIITNGCVKRIKALQKSMSNDDLYLRVVVDSVLIETSVCFLRRIRNVTSVIRRGASQLRLQKANCTRRHGR